MRSYTWLPFSRKTFPDWPFAYRPRLCLVFLLQLPDSCRSVHAVRGPSPFHQQCHLFRKGILLNKPRMSVSLSWVWFLASASLIEGSGQMGPADSHRAALFQTRVLSSASIWSEPYLRTLLLSPSRWQRLPCAAALLTVSNSSLALSDEVRITKR